MPTVIPPWLEASKAPDTYSAMLPEAFKLGAQSDQFAKELALKRSEQQDQMLRAGANLGLESGQQANAMAMNVANLRQQQEEQAQKMQLAWQEEASRIAAEAARLDEAAYQNDLEAAIQQQRIRQESLERLARTDIEREYKKNQYSLGKQKLNDLAAQNKLKNDALAKKAENILNYQRELAAAPNEETRLAVAQKWFPLIGMTGASVSGLFRPKAQPRAETIPGPQGSRLERQPDRSWKQIVAPAPEMATKTTVIPGTPAVTPREGVLGFGAREAAPAVPQTRYTQKVPTSEVPGAVAKATKGKEAFPNAPLSPKDRQKGKTYSLPKGNFTWTGTGWVKAD